MSYMDTIIQRDINSQAPARAEIIKGQATNFTPYLYGLEAVGNALSTHYQGKIKAEAYRHQGIMQELQGQSEKLAYEHKAKMADIYSQQINASTTAKISIRRKELTKNLRLQNLMAGVSGSTSSTAVKMGSVEEFNFDTMLLKLQGEGLQTQVLNQEEEYNLKGNFALKPYDDTASQLASENANTGVAMGLLDSYLKYSLIK